MQKNKSILGLILLLVTVVLYSFWVKPISIEVADLQATLDNTKSQVQSTELENVDKNIKLTSLEKNLLEQAIPTGFDQEKIIKTLNTMAIENLIQINNISFNRSSSADSIDIKTVQMSLNGRASDGNLRSFIHQLENSNRVFIIKNLNLSLSDLGALTQTSFTLNIEAYFS